MFQFLPALILMILQTQAHVGNDARTVPLNRRGFQSAGWSTRSVLSHALISGILTRGEFGEYGAQTVSAFTFPNERAASLRTGSSEGKLVLQGRLKFPLPNCSSGIHVSRKLRDGPQSG